MAADRDPILATGAYNRRERSLNMKRKLAFAGLFFAFAEESVGSGLGQSEESRQTARVTLLP